MHVLSLYTTYTTNEFWPKIQFFSKKCQNIQKRGNKTRNKSIKKVRNIPLIGPTYRAY